MGSLHSPDCDSHRASIDVNGFSCEHAEPVASMDQSVPHSPLYHLFAKEKLDCCIGYGAWGGLFELRLGKRNGLNALFQDGEMLITGRKKWTAQFANAPTPGGFWKPAEKRRVKVVAVLERALNQS